MNGSGGRENANVRGGRAENPEPECIDPGCTCPLDELPSTFWVLPTTRVNPSRGRSFGADTNGAGGLESGAAQDYPARVQAQTLTNIPALVLPDRPHQGPSIEMFVGLITRRGPENIAASLPQTPHQYQAMFQDRR